MRANWPRMRVEILGMPPGMATVSRARSRTQTPCVGFEIESWVDGIQVVRDIFCVWLLSKHLGLREGSELLLYLRAKIIGR